MMRILLLVAFVVAVCCASDNTTPPTNTLPPAPIERTYYDESILLSMKKLWPVVFPGNKYNTQQYAVLAFGSPSGCSLLKNGCTGKCCITDVDYTIREPQRHAEYQLIHNTKGLELMLAKQKCPPKVYLYTYNAPCKNCHNQILTSLKDKLSRKCPYAKVVVGYSCEKANYDHAHLDYVTGYAVHCVDKCTVKDSNGNLVNQNHCNRRSG